MERSGVGVGVTLGLGLKHQVPVHTVEKGMSCPQFSD